MIQGFRGQGDETSENRLRLDGFYERYWPPVFFHVRRYWARDIEEAKDLTQAFFLAFLDKNFLDQAAADRGRFRTFICATLRNFILNERRALRARKRQPLEGLLSIESIQASHTQFDVADQDGEAPADRFLRSW